MPTLQNCLRILILCAFVATSAACNFTQQADAKFGDQHFKTAVALIELYKVRHGDYPASLSDLDFAGDWDRIALGSVDYKRDGAGCELNVTRGFAGAPSLTYPPGFWTGLGLTKSNVKGR